jgi:molecular chaperone HtpG
VSTTEQQTLGFQAEVKQLLHLMIHSLYSNKEIALRELISNASDAVDKLRFEALSNPDLIGTDSDLKIRIDYDKAARTLSVSDNGIGMSRDEVITNIGTIAKSGTKEFLAKLTGDQAKDAHLIGQFGVGFYSSFIIADRVTLITRRAGGEEAVRWESDGAGEYTVSNAEKSNRGTEVILHLKEGEDEFLGSWRIKDIVRKYSDHIAIPIVAKQERWDEAAKANVKGDDDETLNQASALWTRPKGDITDEQYGEFYKHIAHDYDAPLAYVHAKVEGRQEYTQLLFIPAHAPFDLWDRQQRHGLKLYVRRVFIMDNAEQLLPLYLRFVRGVIDSNDLPLNISREILQQSKDVEAIRNGAAKRVLGLLEDLAENDRDKFSKFWGEFGRVMKEGVGEDFANRDRLAKLLRFATTKTEGDAQTASFADYIGRMQEGQDTIYYITADSHLAAKNSPHLEVFRKKDVEVLLLGERVDEWWVGSLPEFDGKKLQSVTRGALDLSAIKSASPDDPLPAAADENKDLLEKIKTALGDKVKEVRSTNRLTESPACLVADEHDMNANLSRMLKAAGQKVPEAQPILEINLSHPIVARLSNEDARFPDWASILFDQALLAEGGQLDDPAGFVRRLNSLVLDLSARAA